MAEINDALNFPYIRIRDADWLKSTLLLFPHVGRIRPYDSPEDSPEIDAFSRALGAGDEPLLRSIYPDSIPQHLQDDLLDHLRSALRRDADGLRLRFGEDATQRENGQAGNCRQLWVRRTRGVSQVHHQKIAPQLLGELLGNGLAWEPRHPDYPGYVEMHRVVGEAVMSSLAFAAAQAQGMRLVTEFPDLFARTLGRPAGDIFSGITAGMTRERPVALDRRGDAIAEAIVFRHCDLDLLDVDSLAMLSREHEALSDFRDSLEGFARSIPAGMTDKAAIAKHVEARARHVIERWTATKRNSLPSFKRIFGEESGKAVQDSLKGAFKDSVKAAAPGALLGSVSGNDILLCAGGGLAIGLAFRMMQQGPEARKEARSLRYLNILQKHGVGISVSAS